MNVALYLRVSTAIQSVEAQRTELRSYCSMKNWRIDREIEDVISGTKSERDGLAELMAGVRLKKWDAVCAVRIDRMARSLAHFAQLVREFEAAGVALVLTAQGIDTSKSNACGQLQMNVLAAVAQFERTLIVERTRAGLVVARANGKVLGRVSAKMPADRVSVVLAWRASGSPGGYRHLGELLGGVSGATAWRVAKGVPAMLEAD